jgi:mono/diheme cytochrome c family protein
MNKFFRERDKNIAFFLKTMTQVIISFFAPQYLCSQIINIGMKQNIYLLLICAVAILTYSCGSDSSNSSNNEEGTVTEESATTSAGPETYDPKRGEGKFTAENVILGETLDAAKATTGESISATKCTSCHKLTDEKLVGPGWAGVTTRRTPEWIMNFITNPDPMIDKDPAVQASLELCLVRMPNQSLTDDDARNILEYMRKNDGVK